MTAAPEDRDGRDGEADRRPVPAREPGRLIDSGALFAGATEIGIAHGEEVYRLRITRQGKLILNK